MEPAPLSLSISKTCTINLIKSFQKSFIRVFSFYEVKKKFSEVNLHKLGIRLSKHQGAIINILAEKIE